MNDTVVEYVNGIEVIKAFNQSSNSYKKYEYAVVDNASFFYNWMKSCQWPMSAYTAICPSNLLTVLPIGCIFYINGTLTAETFVTVMIISMSIIGPILAASNFVDKPENLWCPLVCRHNINTYHNTYRPVYSGFSM